MMAAGSKPEFRKDSDVVLELNPNDVLMGRGNSVNRRPGNTKFREIVESKNDDYNAAKTKEQKDSIAQDVIQQIKNRQGRFLQPISVEINGEYKAAWEIVDKERVMNKVKQTLRDRAAISRKQAEIEANGGQLNGSDLAATQLPQNLSSNAIQQLLLQNQMNALQSHTLASHPFSTNPYSTIPYGGVPGLFFPQMDAAGSASGVSLEDLGRIQQQQSMMQPMGAYEQYLLANQMSAATATANQDAKRKEPETKAADSSIEEEATKKQKV